MIEYRSFIYLQNQKTGSSFVEEFLTRFCNEPRLHYDKHAALARDAGKFCFVNVREPIDQYKSLFAYGLEGRGQIFDRLSAIGEDGLYARGMDGFDGWMRFVLQAENGPLLDRRYTTDVARIMGFMTWRFLRLASPGLEEAAPAWRVARASASLVEMGEVDATSSGLTSLAKRGSTMLTIWWRIPALGTCARTTQCGGQLMGSLGSRVVVEKLIPSGARTARTARAFSLSQRATAPSIAGILAFVPS